MTENRGLLGSGWGMVTHNKRYIAWFYVLNLLLGAFGTVAFVNQAGTVLDHSLRAERLVHGFDLGVALEMLNRPEFGPIAASRLAAMCFSVLFFVLTALFLPGVLQGFAATYRLPREDFFRACGRNLWRFIRLLLVSAVVMIPLTVALSGIQGIVQKNAGESTNELLSPELTVVGLVIIFLVMAVARIWFDLAEVDVVLSDQRAVRRSIGVAFRNTFRHLGELLGSYMVSTLVAVVILLVGIFVWMKLVPPASVAGAFVVSQLTLLMLLIPRFWQRGIVVAYYKKYMVEPIAVHSFTPVAMVAPVTEAEPVLLPPSAETQVS